MKRALLYVLAGVALGFLAVYVPMAIAVDIGKFPLHRPHPEPQLFVCLDQAVALRLMDMHADKNVTGEAALANSEMAAGRCGMISAMVTYKRQVKRIDIGDRVLTVYEAKIGDTTIYVPMEGFLHDDIQA